MPVICKWASFYVYSFQVRDFNIGIDYQSDRDERDKAVMTSYGSIKLSLSHVEQQLDRLGFEQTGGKQEVREGLHP